jgi:hypothetical protein
MCCACVCVLFCALHVAAFPPAAPVAPDAPASGLPLPPFLSEGLVQQIGVGCVLRGLGTCTAPAKGAATR